MEFECRDMKKFSPESKTEFRTKGKLPTQTSWTSVNGDEMNCNLLQVMQMMMESEIM